MIRKSILGLALALALVCVPAEAVVTNTNTQTVTANGTGSTTNYTIGFDFRDNSWITVTKVTNSTGATVNIPYGSGAGKFTITGGNPGTTVVMGTAPTTGEHLIIGRSIPLTQPVNYDPLSAFPASDHMKQMDTFALELQNLNALVTGIANPAVPQPVLPTGQAYSLLGWNSDGSAVVNYTLNPNIGDVLQFDGSKWTTTSFTPSGIMGQLNGQTSKLVPAAGGTGVANNGLLSWGFNNLTFNTSGPTTLTLPTSGTLIAGVVDTGNTPNTIVGRDSLGNISVGGAWATSFNGPLIGNVTGNVTGNVSGTSSNVTGTVQIGHGGTGATTAQAAINALVGSQTTGMVLHSDATANAKMAFLVPSDLPANIPRSKLSQGTANVALINDGSGNVAEVTGGASGNVLTFNGTTWVAAPAASGIPGIFPYGADSGAANAYVVATPNPPVIGYAPGIGVSFKAVNTNTGASTINVSGLGVQTIKHADGSDLVPGDISAGQVVVVEYDGTNFQLLNPLLPPSPTEKVFSSSGTATATQSFITANCSSACTITLPAISALARPLNFYVKNFAGTTVTVQGTGGDLIDGAASAVLNFQWQAITLTPTSNGWLVQ